MASFKLMVDCINDAVDRGSYMSAKVLLNF